MDLSPQQQQDAIALAGLIMAEMGVPPQQGEIEAIVAGAQDGTADLGLAGQSSGVLSVTGIAVALALQIVSNAVISEMEPVRNYIDDIVDLPAIVAVLSEYAPEGTDDSTMEGEARAAIVRAYDAHRRQLGHKTPNAPET